MSEYNIWYELENMIAARAATAIPVVMYRSEDGVLAAYGTTVPTTANTYAVGCEFVKISGTNKKTRYINVGTYAVPVFEAIVTAVAAGLDAGRGPSPTIWDDCPVKDYKENPALGWEIFQDFRTVAALAANQAATLLADGVVGFTDANTATLVPVVDEVNGALTLEPGATDNEDASIGTSNAAGQVVLTDGAAKAFWMEARVKTSTIANTKNNIFAGLAQEGTIVAGGVLTDANAVTDVDCVGFARLAADGDMFDTVHNTASGGGVTEIAADAVTIVAAAYVKLGMKLDAGSNTLKFYKDGVLLATTVDLDASNFPTGEELVFIFACMTATGTAPGNATIDWFRMAQAY